MSAAVSLDCSVCGAALPRQVWTVCDFLATDEMEVERNTTLLAALETKLEQHHPDLAAMVEQKKMEKEIAAAEKAEAEARVNNKKKSSLWERLTS